MPSLRQLEYLVAVADCRHFGRAAQSVHVSQPTLSQQLRALETRLGVTLIARRLGGAELTPIGREIADRARAARSRMSLTPTSSRTSSSTSARAYPTTRRSSSV